ncbi:MAG: hypothetical protein AB8B54_13135 [Sphingorhabdus sp.]
MVGWLLLLTLMALPEPAMATAEEMEVESVYFEGRWAFIDEECAAPSSWTMISGGTFVSEDLMGSWRWQDGQLLLNLDDLAIDEETGEAGGKFRMDGPVTLVDQGRFDFTIAPDVYQLKRCP